MILMYVSMLHNMLSFPLPGIIENNYFLKGLIQGILALAVLIINKRFFINGVKSVIKGSPNMDTLVAMGSGAAFIYSTYVLFAMTDAQVKEFMELLLPIEKDSTQIQSKNILRLREDLKKRYYDAPDLQKVGNNAYRFINAVSDFATHANPLRRTANYNENLFARTIDGNPLIDKAYQLLKTA